MSSSVQQIHLFSSKAVDKVHQQERPRDSGSFFVLFSISDLDHQNTFLRCSRKKWNFLSSFMLSCQGTPLYLLGDSAFADELSTDSLGWDAISSAWSPLMFIMSRDLYGNALMKGTALHLITKSQTNIRGSLTKPEYDPHAHDSLVCQLLHTTNHTAQWLAACLLQRQMDNLANV